MGQPSIQRPKKKERSEKQIASLQKARETRAKKLAENMREEGRHQNRSTIDAAKDPPNIASKEKARWVGCA